jgi:hypothetical protein
MDYWSSSSVIDLSPGLVMDVRDLSTFEDSTFDVAIDKGTMDAIMTAKGDVWVRS